MSDVAKFEYQERFRKKPPQETNPKSEYLSLLAF
jgi:hypothetical protein